MKKVILTLMAALSLAGYANAQDGMFSPGEFDWQFDVRASLTGSSMYLKDATVVGNTRIAPGFNVEAGAALQLAHGFYFRTGLGITDRCTKATTAASVITTGDYTYYNALYLTMPLTVSFRIDFNGGDTVGYLDLGGYLGYGLKGTVRDGSVKTDLYDSPWYFKRFDGGIKFGIGAILREHFLGGLFLDQGLANIYADNTGKAKNYSFGIQFGYVF